MIGALETRSVRHEPSTLVILQGYVPNEGTAWSHARRELGRFYERVLARHHDDLPPALPARSLVVLSDIEDVKLNTVYGRLHHARKRFEAWVRDEMNSDR